LTLCSVGSVKDLSYVPIFTTSKIFFNVAIAESEAKKLVLGFSGVGRFSVLATSLPNSPSSSISWLLVLYSGEVKILTFVLSGPMLARLNAAQTLIFLGKPRTA